jgi:outer membrane protein assembly factor BamD
MKKNSLYIIILILFLSACAGGSTARRLCSDQQWERAERLFNRGRYARAIPYYQQLVFERSSVHTAEAQFKLGESFFRRRGRENYIDAIFEFQELLRLFPDSRWAPDAQFRIAQSYERLSLPPELTQEDTNRSIEHFIRFIERNPTDPRVPEAQEYIRDLQLKLIEKIFLTGRIYYRMRDYSAAELYLNHVIALGNRNTLEKRAIYFLALVHINRQDEENALIALEHLHTYFPDTREARRAQRRFNRMNSLFFRIVYYF